MMDIFFPFSGQDFRLSPRVKGNSGKLVDEEKIISYFFSPEEIPEDDCYFDKNGDLSQGKGKILVSTDSLVGGVHFRLDWSSPEDIAWKLVEVNVSDILSSGGIPRLAFLNLGLSPEISQGEWIEKFAYSLRSRLSFHSIKLGGGDSFRSPIPHFSLTLLGKLSPALKKPYLRSGGLEGDTLFISGPVGYSNLGWDILQQTLDNASKGNKYYPPQSGLDDIDFLQLASHAREKHLSPTSRYDLREKMENLPIHACMDITDGLVQDLEKMAKASQISLRVDMEKLPDWEILQKMLSPEKILTSGEELEFAVLGPSEEVENFIREGFVPIGVSQTMGDLSSCVGFNLSGEKYNITQRGFLHF